MEGTTEHAAAGAKQQEVQKEEQQQESTWRNVWCCFLICVFPHTTHTRNAIIQNVCLSHSFSTAAVAAPSSQIFPAGMLHARAHSALDVLSQSIDEAHSQLEEAQTENAQLKQELLQLTHVNEELMQKVQGMQRMQRMQRMQMEFNAAELPQGNVEHTVMSREIAHLETILQERSFAHSLLDSTKADTSGAFLELLACELFRLEVSVLLGALEHALRDDACSFVPDSP